MPMIPENSNEIARMVPPECIVDRAKRVCVYCKKWWNRKDGLLLFCLLYLIGVISNGLLVYPTYPKLLVSRNIPKKCRVF